MTEPMHVTADSIVTAPLPATVIIQGEGGRTLLAIEPDGSVTGTLEDASETARVFVQEVRRLLGD